MENFLKIAIISIFILNQMIKTESNPIDTSLLEYENPLSEWLKQANIEKEINACYEICNKCFTVSIHIV